MGCANLTKRAEEERLFAVQFLSDYGTFIIDFVSVLVENSEGYNVTDVLIDPAFTSFSGNTAEFMAIGGEEGEQYTVSVAAHMTDSEELIWKGTLTITD